LGTYFNKKFKLNSKSPHHFTMSNKHVFNQLIITHLCFFIVISHQRPKDRKFKIIEIEWKKNKSMKANAIEKLNLNIRKLTNDSIYLTKQFITVFGFLGEPTSD